MKNGMHKLSLFWVACVSFGVASCTDPPLRRLEQLPLEASWKKGKAVLQADFCSPDPEDVKPDLKLSFVIDQSGSNKQTADGNPGTDPIGNRRFAPLVDFVTTFAENDPGLFLSLYTFNTQVLHSKPFSNDHPSFLSKTNQVWHEDASTNPATPRDLGYTDFVSVLNGVARGIQEDMVRSCQAGFKRQVIYSAMFVSDGFPYLSVDQPQAVSDILSAVDRLLVIPEQYKECVLKIILFTGLYFNPAPNDAAPESDHQRARQLMAQMAERGKGTYHEFPRNIDFGVFAIPTRKVKYALRDVLIKNRNLVWSGEELLYDADMDGIADVMEGKLGSDPSRADSDDNGVSDLVEYRVFTRPCRHDRCFQESSNVFHRNLCKRIPFTEASSRAIRFPDTDRDGLNDCEEKLLNSRADLFSTNGSWMPDLLLLLSGMNLVGDPKELAMDWDWDGVSNYREIKGGMPLQIQNFKFEGIAPQEYTLQLVSQDNKKECYHLEGTRIIALRPDDMIRIIVLDSNAGVDVRRSLRTVDRRLTNYELKLTAAQFR